MLGGLVRNSTAGSLRACRKQFSTSASTLNIRQIPDAQNRPASLDINKLQDFHFDDVDASVHLDLEHQRERLHFRRLINYQLPQLQDFREKFVPPNSSQFIKVVSEERWDADDINADENTRGVKISVPVMKCTDLKTNAARHKFRVLAGDNWNSDSDSLELSCDRFPIPPLNEAWCSEVLSDLIREANNTKEDSYADVPADNRATKATRTKSKLNVASAAHIPQDWLHSKKPSKASNPSKN